MDEVSPETDGETRADTGRVGAKSGLLGWLLEGLRVLRFRAPRWDRLHAGPLTVAVLVMLEFMVSIAFQRAWAEGSEPQFLWRALLNGWAGFVVLVWLAWIAALARGPNASPPVSTATLVSLSTAAALVLDVVTGLGGLGLRLKYGALDGWPNGLRWTLWLLPMVGLGLAQLRMFWRLVSSWRVRAVVLLLTPLPLIADGWLNPMEFWWSAPDAEQAESAARPGLILTDEVVARQPALLAEALGHLRAPQPGRVNLYGLTYAPYASQDVFMRESAAVSQTLKDRFGAEGRVVELVVNPATRTTLPWATPLNLRQSIERMASVMDRQRDVLFLHLTSHGGSDGKLATDTWPLETEPLTPERLKRWLDDAGVRWRVISVSACYSGSWIAPLADEHTLVMTAADATHTSYGCGRRSTLTFFGRAMYVDALQETRSFEQAHAKARELIKTREEEAGKSDGYSNPQLRLGEAIRGQLKRLEQELEALH